MPLLLELGEQRAGTAHGVWIPGHALCAAVLPFGDQLGTFQDGDVLLNGGKRHLVPRGQFADRRVRAHHASQDVAPRGIG